MGFYVGIDLGTTNSTVTVIRTEDVDDNPLDTLETCPIYQYGDTLRDYKMGEQCLPSSIFFDIDRKSVYTGIYAKSMYASGDYPMQTIRSVKTRIGGESSVVIPSIVDPNRVEVFDMVQCSSLFIRTILDSLKKQYPKEKVDEDVVVTVPAAFSDDERVATRNAVLLGGFKNCTILDEPSAALLSHINSTIGDIEDEDFDEDDPSYKLVYDIGGGTLDVSIAEIKMDENADYEINVKGLSERMNLGGDDFDQILGAYFLKEFEATENKISERSIEDQNRIIARIVSNAEDYKIELNKKIIEAGENVRKAQRASINVAFELIDGLYVSGLVLQKGILDDIYQSYTKRGIGALLKPVNSALVNAGITKDKIGEVIITGGMSEFYAVREVLRDFFGEDVIIQSVEDTRTAVSRGAALYHWGLDEDNESMEVKRVRISQRMASNIYLRKDNQFELLINEDLEATSGAFDYVVTDDDMTELPIFLYSGNPEADGTDNTKFVPLAGQKIPLQHAYKEGQSITLNWDIDKNKVITISIEEPGMPKFTVSRFLSEAAVKKNIISQYKLN